MQALGVFSIFENSVSLSGLSDWGKVREGWESI